LIFHLWWISFKILLFSSTHWYRDFLFISLKLSAFKQAKALSSQIDCTHEIDSQEGDERLFLMYYMMNFLSKFYYFLQRTDIEIFCLFLWNCQLSSKQKHCPVKSIALMKLILKRGWKIVLDVLPFFLLSTCSYLINFIYQICSQWLFKKLMPMYVFFTCLFK
jgi:hypothetical protein